MLIDHFKNSIVDDHQKIDQNMYTNQFYKEGFESAKITIDEILKNVDDDLFVSLPADGGWCIGEVVSHLNKATDLYLKPLEAKLGEPVDSLSLGSGPYRHPWHMRMFIKVVSPEYRLKVKTFPVFFPQKKADLDRDEVVEHFMKNMDRFITLVEKADANNLDLGKITVYNPVIKWLKMSVSACLAINEAHIRRHFDQINRLIPEKD